MGQLKVDKSQLQVDADGFRPYRKVFKAREAPPIDPIKEVEEVDGESDKEDLHSSEAPGIDLEQLPLATANGFAVLATENEVPMEKVLPNTAPGADSIPSNG